MKISSASGPASTVTFNTTGKSNGDTLSQWWKAKSDKELADSVIATTAYLKESQNFRQRQTAVYARLYGNMPLFNFIGTNIGRMDQQKGLPTDRPTFNLIQSAIDTLVSRLSQSRPAPTFLTDDGDYRERNLAKKLNKFVLGEFHQAHVYEKVTTMLRDALVTGTGCLKIYESGDNVVALDRVLLTELFTDPNDSIYGEPRQLFQVKLVDRQVLMELFPNKKAMLDKTEKAFPDSGSDSSKSVADQIMVVESWHLRSGKKAKDGRHVICCANGVLLDEDYTKDKFPFIFLHFSPRMLGFWGQGLAEQLMGTQVEINSLLYTISRAIKVVGVPRVFVEMGSKVVKSQLNNDVGTIVEYRGTKPSYEVAPAVPQEMYAQLQRLIEYGYQQAGVSQLDAGAKKPAGLESGEALRTYDDIASDRMAALSRRYDNVFIELAYMIVDLAKDIAERDGEYSTIYPSKNGVKMIDLPKASLLEHPYVIQVFNKSSLPRDPAGRLQKVVEMVQAGMISVPEGRRLLDYPDLDQVEKLDNAAEERILQILDEIIEDGKYTPPDPFTNIALAAELATKYINLYGQAKLEEERMEMLRTFFSQCLALQQAAQPPAPPMGPPGLAAPGQPVPSIPQAGPQPAPASPLVPNAVGPQAG